MRLGPARARPGPAVAEKKRSKLSQSPDEIKEELRSLQKSGASDAPPAPPFDIKKTALRVGALVVVLWGGAISVSSSMHITWPLWVVAVISGVLLGAGLWAVRYVKRAQELGAILKGADTDEGRKEALKQLQEKFGDGDVQAVLARAQLEMQDEPRKALATLETVDLSKQLVPVADQVRAMRAMIHLTQGETAEARKLVDAIDLGKQQEPKTRAMFATVAGEAWARTGDAKRGLATLELFNPEDPLFAEMRVQMWRARAFAMAGAGDMKGAGRALKKLSDMSPHLLGMFVGQKKIHPLLEKEAKSILLKSGAVPRKMVRQRY